MTALLFLLTHASWAQRREIEHILDDEFKQGHFNGAALVAHDGKVVARVYRGQANKQFAVPVTRKTRFPIASMTKTFTALLLLQLQEKGLLQLTDPAAKYVPELPANCRHLTIADLLTHHSGLRNEPLLAYAAAYAPADYVKKFVVRQDSAAAPKFNYNNVDYIVLTRVLEVAGQKSYAELLAEHILQPLGLHDTGLVRDEAIIPNLAYGYHNYSFGAAGPQKPLANDLLRHLANYAGAGAVYSTVDDLYTFVRALQADKLLSHSNLALLTSQPAATEYLDYARGYPSVGFYYNDKTFGEPVLERRGSINGFNSVLLTDRRFNRVVILLTNTDTGDQEKIGDRLYSQLK